MARPPAAADGAGKTADGAKATYTCVMHPEIKQDHPGDCPKCGMKLIPGKMIPAAWRQVCDFARMKKLSRLLCLAGLVGGLSVSNLRAATPPNADAEKFLIPYEQVLKALVQDDLPAAKQAAHALPGDAGADIENAKDLKTAREAFLQSQPDRREDGRRCARLPRFLLPDDQGQLDLGTADHFHRQPLHGQGNADLRVEKK